MKKIITLDIKYLYVTVVLAVPRFICVNINVKNCIALMRITTENENHKEKEKCFMLF